MKLMIGVMIARLIPCFILWTHRAIRFFTGFILIGTDNPKPEQRRLGCQNHVRCQVTLLILCASRCYHLGGGNFAFIRR